MEQKLLSAIIHSRGAYEKLSTYIKEEDFTDHGRIIVKLVEEFYCNDTEAQSIDKEVVIQRLEQRYPKHSQILTAAMLDLQPVSIPNIIDVYQELKIHSVSNELIGLLASNKKPREVMKLMDSYRKLVEQKDDSLLSDNEYNIYIERPVLDVMESLQLDNLLQLAPTKLNEVLKGGVPAGTHIVLFARPEIGKSLFSINMASHFLEMGKKVLYVGNEDPADTMLSRFLNRLSLMDKYKILEDPEAAYDKAMDRGYNTLVFAEATPGSVGMVEKLAEEHEPDVIFIDQMRNLKLKKEYSKVESLEYTAQSLRETYKRYNTVGVSITQAGDSAENKAVLDMGDVDFSNTGIPATADLMIGLGATQQMKDTGLTMVSLSKNKVSSVHTYFPVTMNPWLSTVTDAE